MRGLGPWLLMIGLVGAQSDPSLPDLQELLSTPELQEYQRGRRFRDHADVFRKAFRRQGEMLRQEVRGLRLEEILLRLDKVRHLAQHALRETINCQDQKERRSKEVKRLEIRLRKLIDDLNELGRALPFEYRDEFDDTGRALEELRNELLLGIFGKALGPRVSLPPDAPLGMAFYSASPTLPGRLQGFGSERFTEEEFTKIQENQELVKRVEVFLKIAEARVQEWRRRLAGVSWEKKESNPLELFTYWDLVHAYRKALEGIMINIDEKARYRLAEEKDIRKALGKLYEKVEELAPQLQPLQQLSIERRDEELFREVEAALEASRQAREGALMGLGAPPG